jgi:hypothetical protein
MAQSLATKKLNFLSNTVAAAQALKNARDALKQLQEQYNANATYSGITQGDIDGPGPGPSSVDHLTPTILANLYTVVQPALETALSAHLASLLDVLPN